MKKVIRLTESDLEQIVRRVLSEQRRDGGNLVGAPKRKSPNRDESSSSWGGGYEGTLNLNNRETFPFIAVNVGGGNFKITMQVHASSGSSPVQNKSIPPTQTGSTEFAEFEIKGSELPYADNMVKPDFDKYPDAGVLFGEIVTAFVNYIKAGGGPKLTNVTIKGSADSARPTLDVPSGYSKLDHPDSKPYNGETDPKKMNQYLADNRAKEYAKLLINKIKELTGDVINIKILPGDNYYGQEGKRGEEFRKITLTPNAELLQITEPTSSTTPDTQKSGSKVNIPNIPYEIDYYKDGEENTANGYKVHDKGHPLLAISTENAEKWGTPFFENKLNASIQKDKFFIDDKLVGLIKSKETAPVEFYTGGMEYRYWVGPITRANATRNVDIEGEGTVNVTLVDNVYFLFF